MQTLHAHLLRGLTTRYFQTISIVVLVLSVVGFSDNLFWDVGQPSNSDPKFIVHGLFCLGWMVMLVVQTSIVAKGNTALHKRLGIVGALIALGTVLSTVYVFASIWQGWENMAPFVKANRVLFASFTVSVGLALFFRKKPPLHRRFMIAGTFFMMEPILSRVFGTAEITILKDMNDPQLDFYWYVVVFALWGLLFASLFAHDWLTTRRLHPISWGAALWLVVTWTAVQFI